MLDDAQAPPPGEESTVGQRLRWLIVTKHRLSVEAAAKPLKIASAQLGRYVRDVNELKVGAAVDFAARLKCDLEWLLTGKGRPELRRAGNEYAIGYAAALQAALAGIVALQARPNAVTGEASGALGRAKAAARKGLLPTTEEAKRQLQQRRRPKPPRDQALGE